MYNKNRVNVKLKVKVLSLLLSAVMVVGSFTGLNSKVKAAETPKSGSTVYCYTEDEYYFYAMDADEKDIDRTIVLVGNPNTNFKNVKDAVNKSEARTAEEDRVFTNKHKTFNSLSWFVSNMASMESYLIQSEKKNGKTISMDYVDERTPELTAEGIKEYASARKVLLNGLKGLNLGACSSDVEVITKVSDWICSKLTYDADSEYEENRDYFSIVTGKGVCEEYSEITALALQELGYQCEKIGGYGWTKSGKKGAHAWNAVLMSDGKWYEVDNTWRDSNNGGYMLMDMRSNHEPYSTESGSKNESVKYVLDNLGSGTYTNTSTKRLLNAFLIDIKDSNQVFKIGDTYTLPNDKLKNVVSDNPSVVSVENGKLVCHKAGRANITRNDGTYQSGFAVLVKTDTTPKISVKSTLTVKAKKTAKLNAKVTNNWFKEGMSTDHTQATSYKSSNKKVVEVTSTGVIKGIKEGTATITIKCGSTTKTVKVTVK
nr:transglutaminase domain-containing protein [uncultured Anaerosporobacter sp.]